eukprot:TRINITY_DN2945_c0_g1_i12.p1 TRINITY_DN2945_c0_g1~~TRINITY_DN2945_c0_g1_i12.p1  ORF type:complete len:507 (+),score=107.35 TRINITY_DN2945_c0_g1_i12:169-1689(+)
MTSCSAAYGQGYGSGYAAATLPSAYYGQMKGYYAGSGQNHYGNMQGEYAKGGSSSFTPAYMGAKESTTKCCSSQQELSNQHRRSEATIQLSLDDFSDFSDSDDEELLDSPMKSKEFADVRSLALRRTMSTRTAGEPDMEPMVEPSSSGAHEKTKCRDVASLDDISEGELTRTGSQTSDRGSAESEPEAEEPLTPCVSSHHALPTTPSNRFGIVDGTLGTPVKGLSPLKLEVSENSWAAHQHKAGWAWDTPSRPSDEQVARSIKSILNKLTFEKFESLFKQLVGCGLRSAAHAELLIHEIFEKATTQHHFVDMYADLCIFLEKHFTDHPFVADAAISAGKEDKNIGFKRLLLDECQASFEMRSQLSKVDTDDEVAALRYKTRMLGNIKLVGALLSRDMLAAKVGLAILEELLCSPTPESLECAALLLTTAGPALDRPGRSSHAALNHIFARIAELVKGTHCRARERFLLKDLLELRANCWVDHRPKKLERATTLEQVAQQANGRQQW